jgi:SnoaL-like protein
MGDIAVGDDDFELTLDESAVQAHLSGLHTHDFDKAHRVYRRDAVLIQPQLGTTITGRDNIKAARSAHPERELDKVDVVMGQGDLWVAECLFTMGARKVLVVSVIEFCEGQIIREREYTCELGTAA